MSAAIVSTEHDVNLQIIACAGAGKTEAVSRRVVCYSGDDVSVAIDQVVEDETLVDLRPEGPEPAVDR
jgi:hypothetical protein